MADIGRLKALAAGIPDPTTKRIITEIVEELAGSGGGMTWGDPDHQRKATNHRGHFQVSTTATSTGEFSIAHGIGTAPTLAIPVLDLGQPGSQIVPVEVTKAADSQRIYLRSGSTGARFVLLVE